MKKSLMIVMLLSAVALYGQQMGQSAQPQQQQQQQQQTGGQGQMQGTQPGQQTPPAQPQQQPGQMQPGQTQPGQPGQPAQPGQQPQPGQQAQPGQMQQTQPGQMQQTQPGQTQPGQPGEAQQPGAMQQPGQPGAQAAGAQCPQGETVPEEPSGPAPPAPKAPEIKDQAEYNAYVAAVQAPNPQAKASGLEGFLNTYPNSAAKRDALNTLMFLYSQTGNAERLQATAQKATEADANNAIAWYFLSVLLRGNIEGGKVPAAQVPQTASELAQDAQKGLQALPQQPKLSDQMTDAQFQQLRDSFYQEFIRDIGFAALQTKDYCKAQQYLTAVAAKQNPQDPQAFASAYQLATAYLEQTPPNPVGFWWAARAINLAPAQSKGDIQKYATYKYTKYHGDTDGWNEIMTSAASATAPPAGFTVAPAPTPPEQAAKMVASKPVDQMSLDEIQFILTSGNQQAADQVWNAIKDKPIAAEGKYVGPGSDPDTIQVAGLYDDINANPPKADINLTLAVKPGAKQMPQPGATVDFQGNPQSFTPNPFVITMDKGCLIDMKTRKCMTATATPAHPTRRPASRGTTRGTTRSTTRKPPAQ